MTFKGRILIADDDEAFRTTIKSYLESNGYECEAAANASEAKALLAGKEFELLISDIDMPGNANLQLIKDVPQIQGGLPVILATGMPTMETAIDSVRLSVVAYLVKPIEPEVVLSQVAKAVEKYRFYKMAGDIRRHAAQTNSDLEKVEKALLGASPETADSSMQALMDISIAQVTRSLLDLRCLTDMASTKQNPAQSLEGLNESRPAILLHALWETVAVLEKTKSSFHSKELGELRRKLTHILND